MVAILSALLAIFNVADVNFSPYFMKIFLSWSGLPSQSAAKVLEMWLPRLLQYVTPFISEEIEKGSRGLSVIADELQATDYGIICLTHENVTSPWVNFEAGALSKALNSARVCPLLFGIQKMEVKGPLSQFQMAYPKKDEFHALLRSINDLSGDKKISDHVLSGSLDAMWSNIDESFNKIIAELSNQKSEPELPESEINAQALDEMLEILRNLQRNTKEKVSTGEIADALHIALNRYSGKSEYLVEISPQNLWSMVITKSKPQLKSFLREANVQVGEWMVEISYSAKHKWHADQVKNKFDELNSTVQEVYGSNFGTKLIMPDGTVIKNPDLPF